MGKAHAMEIQINGGSVAEKVDFCAERFEKEVAVDEVFAKDENIDTVGVSRGRGTQGVVTRWGPSRLAFSVARAGQHGFHHRTEANKKIYKLGKVGTESYQCTTGTDPTVKEITPLGD